MTRLMRANILVGALALLAGAQVYETFADAASPIAEALPPIVAARTEIREVRLTLPGRHRFDALVDRPLFVESRRPPAPEPVVEETRSVERPYILLTGIARAGDVRRAILRGKDGGQTIVALGERLGAWTIVEISDRGIALALGDDRIEAELGVEQDGAAAAAGAAPDPLTAPARSGVARIPGGDMTDFID